MKLKIENLKVVLADSGKELVNSASFHIVSGEISLIRGANGSGKSSLLSGIFKHPLYRIESGKVLLKTKTKAQTENESESGEIEKELQDKKTFEIAKEGLYLSMQHVPEIDGVNLLQFLYRSYSNVSKDENKSSIVDFHKNLKTFCERYEIDEKFLKRDLNVGLSGGEKKLVEMLHLFALAPDFVFMDEPDSGVDKDAIKKVFQIIADLQKEKGTAFCIVSHHQNLDEYIKVDREYEMVAGVLK